MKSHRELLPLLDMIKAEIKKSDTVKDMCKEHGVELDYIDLVPMAFADLDVSARTDKGCIYFNYKLIDDFLQDHLHYCVHELKHNFQQCYGDGPTEGSSDDDYLDNEFEQEGFQAQTEYIDEKSGPKAADNYIEKVMDHHEVPKEDRKDRKDQLLQIAKLIYS